MVRRDEDYRKEWGLHVLTLKGSDWSFIRHRYCVMVPQFDGSNIISAHQRIWYPYGKIVGTLKDLGMTVLSVTSESWPNIAEEIKAKALPLLPPPQREEAGGEDHECRADDAGG